MKNLNALDWIAIIVLIVGGLNWGLVGVFNLDLIKAIFGDMSALSRVIYLIVGTSAVYVLAISFQLVKIKGEPVSQQD
ncbi:MAG: DUF378 domain-containing protein [Patescibacteria group bacterium]